MNNISSSSKLEDVLSMYGIPSEYTVPIGKSDIGPLLKQLTFHEENETDAKTLTGGFY